MRVLKATPAVPEIDRVVSERRMGDQNGPCNSHSTAATPHPKSNKTNRADLAEAPGYRSGHRFETIGSRFESLVLSHHSRFTCECNKEEINDDDDDCRLDADVAARAETSSKWENKSLHSKFDHAS